MNAMYIAFVKHNIMPSVYFTASPSEKKIIKVFLAQEYEEEKRAADDMKRKR